jgi:ferredoxin
MNRSIQQLPVNQTTTKILRELDNTMSNTNAREQALKILYAHQSKPTSIVTLQSQGRVVILTDAETLPECKDFPTGLSVTRVLVGKASDTKLAFEFEYQAEKAQHITISGNFGNFEITLGDSANDMQKISADIILDTTQQPFYTQQVLPLGYLHQSLNSDNKGELQQELLDMVGVFEKPKYFKHDPSICAHSSNGRTVCTQCIDACPAEAIISLNNLIEVNPNLCQGGGTCATVCPSGAMQYVYPSLQDNGNRLRKMLHSYREQGGAHALVVFHCEEVFPEPLLQQHDNLLPFQLEELASIGAELWLSAIVYGAERVVLLANDDVPAISLEKLQQQLDWCHSILEGLNLDPAYVSLLSNQADLVAAVKITPISAAEYTMPENKRRAMFQAVDHIYKDVGKTREVVELSAEAPFGQAIIDENRCTLCMACVGACPGKALQDGSNREVPEIFFIESHCIQCGICTHTCPEDAIAISPRLILDREKRNQSKVLCQDSPFACISCGKAFAPASVIAKMTHALKDHHMFTSDRAKSRLKMCDDCRVADIVQDPEALNGNFDPLNPESSKRLS